MERVNKKHKTQTWDDFLAFRQKSQIPEALECLLQLNNGLAFVQLGKAYHLGLYGLKVDNSQSIHYLRESDHPLSRYYLHVYHKYSKDSIGTDHLFLKALDCLDNKKPHDYEKNVLVAMAISLFTQCGEKARIYESFFHLSQIDKSHRVKHLKRGALLGDEECQIQLCKYYESKLQYNKSWPFIRRYWQQIPEKRPKEHSIYDDMDKYDNCYRIIICILAARNRNDTILWYFPKDIVKMIAKMVWDTRCDNSWISKYIYS